MRSLDHRVHRCERTAREKPAADASPGQRHWRQYQQDEEKTRARSFGTLQRHGNLYQMNDAPVLDDRQLQQPDWRSRDAGQRESFVRFLPILSIAQRFGGERQLYTAALSHSRVRAAKRVEQAEETFREAGTQQGLQ